MPVAVSNPMGFETHEVMRHRLHEHRSLLQTAIYRPTWPLHGAETSL